MAATLKLIRQRVRFFLDEPVQANFLDADINYAINEAQQEVMLEIAQAGESFFVNTTPTVLNVVAGTQFYALADDFWKMVRMEDANTGVPVSFGDQNSQAEVGRANAPLLTVNQLGSQAFIAGNSIGFRPTPTAPQKFNYWYVPIVPDLSRETDQSPIPRPFVDILALRASIDGLVKDESEVQNLERQYIRRWNQLVRAVRDRQSQNPKYVRRVSSGYGLF